MAQFDDLNSFISECQKNVNAIEEYTGCDPLAPWYQYLQWIDENFTIDFKHETIFDQILSACLCKFENDDRYKQDRRLIKLFIKYIHFQEDQYFFYEKMVASGIGNKVAELYINWAFYFNMKRDSGAAEQIFQCGFDAYAEPMALLKKAHDDFRNSLTPDIFHKNNPEFQRQRHERLQKQLQEITALRMNDSGYSAPKPIKSKALHLFAKEKLENCIPFRDAERIMAGQKQHNESLVQNIIDSTRKMRQNQNQNGNVRISGVRLNFDDSGVDSSSDNQTHKPIPLPANENMYEKGIQIGKNWPRKNLPQKIAATCAYFDPDIGTYRDEIRLPGYDKIMLIPATNVAFSPEELKAYRWFKERNITNAFTIEHDQFWATGYGAPIRCADTFARSNFTQTECHLPRIAQYTLNDERTNDKWLCNTFELYPENSTEEFSLEEIMWRKRQSKSVQLQADGAIDCKTSKKLVARNINRTNSAESSIKLSPIVEMGMGERAEIASGSDTNVEILEPQESEQLRTTVTNELPSKKRKSSIFSAFDALNVTCTTQTFDKLLHRSVISTPNAKIPRYDTSEADSTSDCLPEEIKSKLSVDSNAKDVVKQPPNSNDRNQFAIYEDSMKVASDMKQEPKNIKNGPHTKSAIANKENIFAMTNQMKLERSKLALSGACRTEVKNSNTINFSCSQSKSESTKMNQSQQSKCKSQALSSVQPHQQSEAQLQLTLPPQPPPTPTTSSLAPFEIFTKGETQQDLLHALKNASAIFGASIIKKEPSSNGHLIDRNQEYFNMVNEMAADVLKANTTSSKKELTIKERSDLSTSKEPTDIANITAASAASSTNTNNLSKKTPNQTQYIELLDTTAEFEALEALCASPPTHDATLTPIEPIANKLTENHTPNVLAENPVIDKTLVMSPQKTAIVEANGTSNIEFVETQNQAKENQQQNKNDDEIAVASAESTDEDEDDIGKSIYIPQPELIFDEKDADWHEVTVFLEKETTIKNEYQADEVDMNETRQRIDTHMLNMKDLNPFDPELQRDVLIDIGFFDELQLLGASDFNCTLMNIVKPLKPKASVEIGKQKYQIRKLIGEGAYGKVFTAENTKTKQTYAFKQQRPPNLWEYYICLQVRKRIENQWIRNGLMMIDFAVIGKNATIYASKFAKYGTILDVCQKIKQNTNKNIDECVIMILVKQMFTVLEHLHAAKFIHADIKPDNFLLMDKLSLDYKNPEIVVQLIDFGQSIDLNYFSNHVFWAKVRTEHFVCTEMMENKPWTFHHDFFCLASTIYTMVAGKYMIVKRNKSTKLYKPQKLPRYVNAGLWDDIFDQLINIPSLNKLPSLSKLRERLDTELKAIGSKNINNAIDKFNKALDR